MEYNFKENTVIFEFDSEINNYNFLNSLVSELIFLYDKDIIFDLRNINEVEHIEYLMTIAIKLQFLNKKFILKNCSSTLKSKLCLKNVNITFI